MLKRYVLLTLLDEKPTELLTSVFGDLFEEEYDPALESSGTANRSGRSAAIDALIAKARAGGPLIRRELLIDVLPGDIVEPLVPRICAAMADENEDLRRQAMAVILNVCGNHKSGLVSENVETRCIVTTLRTALTDRLPEVREWAAEAMALLGPAASDLKPALHDAIANEHESTVRARMEAALRQLGSAGSGKLEPH